MNSSSNSNLITACDINVDWLIRVTGIASIIKVECEDLAKAGGLSGELTRLQVDFSDGRASTTYVMKCTKKGTEERSSNLNLGREALFYRDLSQNIGLSIPKCYFADVDLNTGERVILMEDLSDAVQAGHFFGNHSPLNWGKDLTALCKDMQLDSKTVTRMAFFEAAKLHASFWQSESLEDHLWLRGVKWSKGDGEKEWQTSQDQCKEYWAKTKLNLVLDNGDKESKSEEKPGYVKWNPLVVDCIEASLSKVNWSNFQEELRSRPYTLVHGDFHPANMMIKRIEEKDTADDQQDIGKEETSSISENYHEEYKLVMVDFEVVGLGSGPQDLGQFLISHTPPNERKEIEEDSVREYYNSLCAQNPKVSESLTWEMCWKEYQNGGIGRWMWFLPLLNLMCPPPMAQYFHDQVLDFLKSHDFTPENIPMPRV